jgi:hypothetical protein
MEENPFRSPLAASEPAVTTGFWRKPTALEWLVILAIAVIAAVLFLAPNVDDGPTVPAKPSAGGS